MHSNAQHRNSGGDLGILGAWRPYITLLSTFIIERKAKFQLEVNKNRIAIFFPSKFTDPYRP
jgi:hypothetical protein